LDVEGVVHGGAHGDEALGGTGRLEPLHLALPSPDRLVRNLGPVVAAQALFVPRRDADLGKGGAIA
jgi:hypothetical protein